jgi:hypothetical protein
MKKGKFITLLAVVVGLVIANYFILMPLNPRYKGTFFVYVVLFLGVAVLFSKNLIKTVPKLNQMTNTYVNTIEFEKGISGLFSIAFILVFLHFNSATPIFFAKSYQQMLGEVKTDDFTEDFSAISVDQLPIVDHSYGELLGDKKLGEQRGLGSEFYVGTYTDIVVDGQLYLVAPLEYRDFFKWMGNSSEGIPGYIKVNKVTGDAELVQQIDGKDLGLKYMPSAYFSQDLHRHVYYNGHMDNQLYGYYFEIDDAGNPYWVIPKTTLRVSISGGLDIKTVVTVNAQTGEVNEYTPEDAPAWIDNIYPKEIVLQQINNWGRYVNGFLNSVFGEKDVISTTAGSRRVYNNGLYHYTGLTSIGADQSTVGFIFTSTRTKEATYYQISGATEQAAMSSAEGKVQNLRYSATFPIPMNIQSEPTFFITLKDAKGLIKQYAFVNINDFSIVGNGETISKARIEYLKALNLTQELPVDNSELTSESGTVTRIGSSVVEGTTIYYILLDNGKIYQITSSVSNEVSLTAVGDLVEFEYNSNNEIFEFDNTTIE